MDQMVIMAWLRLPLIGSYSQKNIEEKKTKFLETLSRSNFSQIEKDVFYSFVLRLGHELRYIL